MFFLKCFFLSFYVHLAENLLHPKSGHLLVFVPHQKGAKKIQIDYLDNGKWCTAKSDSWIGRHSNALLI